MENLTTGQSLHRGNKAQIRNVMIKHLHSVYYCKVYALEYLVQAKVKVQNQGLQKLLDQVIAVLKDHIGILDQFYAKLHIQPDNTYMSGIRSYTQEAMVVFLMQSKIQYEKELIMLSYLDVISAINATQIRMLDRMARSLGIRDTSFGIFIKSCEDIAKAIEKIAGSYLD